MKLEAIKNIITSKAGRQILTLQKNSPAIMFGTGVVGVAATVVLACRATLKVEQEVLIDAQKNLGLVRDYESETYTEEDRTKDIALIYVKAAGKLTKLYGPAVLVGISSVALLTGSHVALTRRNAGLTAAYVALEKGFNQYRDRVRDEFGDEKDREFRYGVEEIVTEGPKGEKVVVRRANTEDGPSIYAKLFDENSSSWNGEPTYDMIFLKAQQQFANDKLNTVGHVFLNEVYDALGLDRTPAGQIVGWVKGNRDSFVDFGIFNDQMEPEHLAFFTGREKAIWLDFNVDGPVHHLI